MPDTITTNTAPTTVTPIQDEDVASVAAIIPEEVEEVKEVEAVKKPVSRLKKFIKSKDTNLETNYYNDEERAKVTERSVTDNYIDYDASAGTDANLALHKLILGDEDTNGIPKNTEVLDVDYDSMVNNINGDETLSATDKARYGRVMGHIKNIQDGGFKIVRAEGGRYWIQDTETGEKKYAANGILEVKEALDKYRVGGAEDDEEIIIPEDADVALKLPEGMDSSWSKADMYNGAAIGVDLVSSLSAVALKFTGAAAPVGVGVSAVGGLASIGLSAYGDWLDESVSGWEMAGNIATRVGLEAVEAVTVVPASLIAKFSKTSKAFKVMQKAIHYGMAAGAVSTVAGGEWLEVMNKDVSDWELDDVRSLATMAQYMIGFSSSAHTKYQMKKGLGTATAAADTSTLTSGKKAVNRLRSKVINDAPSETKIQAKKYGRKEEGFREYNKGLGKNKKAAVKSHKDNTIAADKALKDERSKVIASNRKASSDLSKSNKKYDAMISNPKSSPRKIALAKKIKGQRAERIEAERALIEKQGSKNITAISASKVTSKQATKNKLKDIKTKANKSAVTADKASLKARKQGFKDRRKEREPFVKKNKAEVDKAAAMKKAKFDEKLETVMGSAKSGKMKKKADTDYANRNKSKEKLKEEKANKKLKEKNTGKLKEKVHKLQKERDELNTKISKKGVTASKEQKEKLKSLTEEIKVERKSIANKLKERRTKFGKAKYIGDKAGKSLVDKATKVGKRALYEVKRAPYRVATNDPTSKSAALKGMIYNEHMPVLGNRYKKKSRSFVEGRLEKMGYSKEDMNKYSDTQLRKAYEIVRKKNSAKMEKKAIGGKLIQKYQVGGATEAPYDVSKGLKADFGGLVAPVTGFLKRVLTTVVPYAYEVGMAYDAGKAYVDKVQDINTERKLAGRDESNITSRHLAQNNRTVVDKNVAPEVIPAAVPAEVNKPLVGEGEMEERLRLVEEQNQQDKSNEGATNEGVVDDLKNDLKKKQGEDENNAGSPEEKEVITKKYNALVDKIDSGDSNDPNFMKSLADLSKYIKVSDFMGQGKIMINTPVFEEVSAPVLNSRAITNMPGFDYAERETRIIPRSDTGDAFASHMMQKNYYNAGLKQRSALVAQNANFIEAGKQRREETSNRNVVAQTQANNENKRLRNRSASQYAQQLTQAEAAQEADRAKRRGQITNGIYSFMADTNKRRTNATLDKKYNKLYSQKAIWNTEYQPRVDAAVKANKPEDVTNIKNEFAQKNGVNPDSLTESMLNMRSTYNNYG